MGGSIAEIMTGPRTAAGTITGDLAGSVRAVLDTTNAGAEEGSRPLRSRHRIVTGRADTLFTEDEGVLVARGEGAFRITSTLTVARGSGSHDGTAGTLWIWGDLDYAFGVGALRYDGELCGNEG